MRRPVAFKKSRGLSISLKILFSDGKQSPSLTYWYNCTEPYTNCSCSCYLLAEDVEKEMYAYIRERFAILKYKKKKRKKK